MRTRLKKEAGYGEVSGGAEELGKKRELIIFGYLARKSHPKFHLTRDKTL